MLPALWAKGADVVEIVEWARIAKLLPNVDVVEAVARAFRLYSEGCAVIPPVGELQFADPPGDVHIKYGYLTGGDYYVVKIASGFYQNPSLGLSSCMGLMLLFEQRTGAPAAVLLDEGRLTDIRTGAAGAVIARVFAPPDVSCIGILGTGIQAREQARQLLGVMSCRKLVAWGRTEEKLAEYVSEMRALGYDARAAHDPQEVAALAQFIVTTTPSREALLEAAWIRPGTHITAVGSDIPEKQELDAAILSKATWVVADSMSQCLLRGEIHHAIAAGTLDASRVTELGAWLGGRPPGVRRADDISVADLTGVAVQDLAIATAVLRAHRATG